MWVCTPHICLFPNRLLCTVVYCAAVAASTAGLIFDSFIHSLVVLVVAGPLEPAHSNLNSQLRISVPSLFVAVA